MQISDDAIGLDRIYALIEKQQASMSPGERLFYQRCTVCHGPRDPAQYTKLQWQGITESMFPRAGLEESERQLVVEFLNTNASDAVQ
jgi:trimethylamine-N-oxide reductase (cytochrome c)